MKKNNSVVSISVVVPVFNSKATLDELHQRIVLALSKLKKKYEIIYVDDASSDQSFACLKKIYQKRKNIKVIRLTQNFGQHNAIMCGLSFSKGEIAITLDDDLQNPPEEMEKLIKTLKRGSYDLVYGDYKLKHHSFFRNFGSNLIQLVYKKIFGVCGNLTSFRAIRKNIVQAILGYKKNYTFVDGLLAWQTKNIGYAKVEHQPRKKGKSGYSFSKLLFLSLNMLTNFSVFPLQLASITGFFFSLVGFFIGLFVLFKKILFGIPVTGFASLFVSITIFSGIQLITIGLIGEYVGRIYLNLNLKPQYSVSEALL